MGFYQKTFASKYDSFMNDIEKQFHPIRQKLISELEGQILDVGSGTGANFEHFNKNATVIAIEPSQFMLEKATKKLPQSANISTYNLGVNDLELENILSQNSLDYVVCTLVLCTITDQNLALKKIKKWLKPNGKLIILEHIHAKQKSRRIIQNIINPAWKIVGDGCNLNRDTDQLIKSIGFKVESEAYFKRTLRFYQGVFVK